MLQSSTSFCQKLQAGYANIGSNYGYLCLDVSLSGEASESCTNIGVGAFLGSKNNELVALPEIHFNIIPFGTLKTDNYFTKLFMTEVAATTKSFNPSIGINLLDFIKLKSGYAFPYDKSTDFKGVTFGVVIQITGYKLKLIQ